MRYLSVFSGIEAATVAWRPLGWQLAAYAEIDKFASAVTAHHNPGVPNLGDVTTADFSGVNPVDLVVGGSPCQSFSIAGKRLGLDDPRGNLALKFGQIVYGRGARWFVFENVPGLLSSDAGWDFGTFLAALAGYPSGSVFEPPQDGWKNSGIAEQANSQSYGLAWRVLDAQYVRVDGFARAVPQRRRRVFVVGYLGDWRRAAAVLFERDSMSGHPAPRREAGQGTAPTLSARTKGGGGLGTDFDCDGGLVAANVAPTMRAGGNVTGGDRPYGTDVDTCDSLIALNGLDGVSHALCAKHSATGRYDPNGETFVAHSLRGGGFDKSHANAGVMPAVMYRQEMQSAYASQINAGALLRRVRDEIGEEAFAEWGLGILDTLQPAEILRSALHGCELRPAAFSRRWVVYCALSREEGRTQGAVQSMREAAGDRRTPQGWQPSQQLARELGAYLSELPQPGAQAERFMHDMWIASEGLGVLRQALSAVQKARRPSSDQDTAPQDVSLREGGAREGDVRPALHGSETAWRVRRLLVEECEFLQGFPRGYTAVPYRGKDAADGPRYKALGNSMAINAMRWIGTRIQMVEQFKVTEAA